MSLHVMLLVASVVCFVLDAFAIPSGRVNLFALGAAFFVASFI